MAPVMRSQHTFFQRFEHQTSLACTSRPRCVIFGQAGRLPLLLAAALLCSSMVSAQALDIQRLSDGVEVILVALPFSDASTVVWPEVTDGGAVELRSTTSGTLTFTADVEAALGPAVLPTTQQPAIQQPASQQPGGSPGVDDASRARPVPPVVLIVGNAQVSETVALLERLLAGRPIAEIPAEPAAQPAEGGVERRLGAPGEDGRVRLELPLPLVGDWSRPAVEVLVELLPRLLATQIEGLRSRRELSLAVLEVEAEPELTGMKLDRLRLALARLGASPDLAADEVEAARDRLAVRRRAQLEEHPAGALELLAVWRRGGTEAVRRHLFGLDGVTLATVRQAALEWLPAHPGAATLVLPPRVFDPRFAPPPIREHLDNDLSVALLERPATPLSTLSLRPVLLPDVDGELSATILTRLAVMVRSHPSAPGWVQVRQHPPSLELGAPADGYGELIEVLAEALANLADDEQLATPAGDTARRRALNLIGIRLGLGRPDELSASSLLEPGNLALGMVTPDAEAGLEALRKLLVRDEPRELPQSSALITAQRTREAAPGDSSTLVVALALSSTQDAPESEVMAEIMAELLTRRAAGQLEGAQVEVLHPLVPGRSVLLVVIEATAQLPKLEEQVRKAWSTWLRRPEEDELAGIRRTVAARIMAEASGPLGRARRCAAVAAGGIVWSPPSQIELEALTLESEVVESELQQLRDIDALQTTGAGVMPVAAPGTDRAPGTS